MSYQVEDPEIVTFYMISYDIPFRLHVFDMYVAVALYTSHFP